VIEAVREAMREEMQRDSRVLVLGEDVGRRGGVFLATQGFIDEFGEGRVIDTPLAEAAILGIALGAAFRGLRPISEIQFSDFVWPAANQLIGEAGRLSYGSHGALKAPLVVRIPYGGGIRGGLFHSQNIEAYFCHTPGLKVIAPATPYDAKGLLKAAIRDDNPVVYFEHKYLYRRAKGPVPEGDEVVPIGEAAIRREGGDVTLITYAAMVQPSLDAAERVARDGIEVEVIDLRTLQPFDKDTIFRSIEKTSRVVIVHEDVKTLGIGAELSATIMEEQFDRLDAPVLRITSPDTHCPFSHILEHENLPNAGKIEAGLRRVAAY
jgi:2-oxoisovalerate dehydrogenase E1 component beta subunit